MTDLTKYFLQEMRLHPSLAPQDVVKFCFQAAFGAEHLLGDLGRAREQFDNEYASTQAENKPFSENIAPTVCRVNLSAWKRLNLNPDWLWNLFLLSAASHESSSNGDTFENYIAQADELCRIGEFPFSYAQWREYVDAYKHAGITPVRHSAAYREAEKPAYRIISGQNAQLLPIFEAMSGLDKGIIAIDGRAASGKSTLADNLYDIINAGIIRMDDFFLPPELRTAERLAKPGGNIHHERFIQEVLPYIGSGNAFKYRKFDCSRMDFSNTQAEVPPHPWRIVEGVYSHHPALGGYMDIRVFMDIQPEKQKSRIQARNSPEIAEQYLDKWIPMEEAYFKAHIREAADVIIQT